MVLRFDLNPVSSSYYSSPDVPLIILSMALSIILLGRGIGVREGGQGAVDPPKFGQMRHLLWQKYTHLVD